MAQFPAWPPPWRSRLTAAWLCLRGQSVIVGWKVRGMILPRSDESLITHCDFEEPTPSVDCWESLKASGSDLHVMSNTDPLTGPQDSLTDLQEFRRIVATVPGLADLNDAHAPYSLPEMAREIVRLYAGYRDEMARIRAQNVALIKQQPRLAELTILFEDGRTESYGTEKLGDTNGS